MNMNLQIRDLGLLISLLSLLLTLNAQQYLAAYGRVPIGLYSRTGFNGERESISSIGGAKVGIFRQVNPPIPQFPETRYPPVQPPVPQYKETRYPPVKPPAPKKYPPVKPPIPKRYPPVKPPPVVGKPPPATKKPYNGISPRSGGLLGGGLGGLLGGLLGGR